MAVHQSSCATSFQAQTSLFMALAALIVLSITGTRPGSWIGPSQKSPASFQSKLAKPPGGIFEVSGSHVWCLHMLPEREKRVFCSAATCFCQSNWSVWLPVRVGRWRPSTVSEGGGSGDYKTRWQPPVKQTTKDALLGSDWCQLWSLDKGTGLVTKALLQNTMVRWKQDWALLFLWH